MFSIAAKTRVVVWQNIVMALGIKGLFMVLGVVGLSGLWEAVFADVGVALLAVLNATRTAR
jgi:Cd2+/Zn2+-exporting ATPase